MTRVGANSATPTVPPRILPDCCVSLKATPSRRAETTVVYALEFVGASREDIPATFAAVPHIIRVLANSPMTNDASFLQFPAWVEICRQRDQVPVPDFLVAEYFDELRGC